MTSRSTILGRIRDALRHPSPQPQPPSSGQIFAEIPEAELVNRFEREVTALKAGFFLASNEDAARAWIKQLVQDHAFKNLAAAPESVISRLLEGLPGVKTVNQDFCGKALADVDLGVTGCDFLVAATGSVVLTAQKGFGRALSVLPQAHLVIARRDQLVPLPWDAFHQLQVRHGTNWPSMITFISGASRTADIEKILVMGAHGPKELFVLILDDATS